uniref:Uncharacterized protein n=1 Tax=Clytia hemisphaerica TaxID=252671 RepID=A0A7M5XG23_9CNID
MMQSQNTKEIVRNALSSMLMKNRRNTNSWTAVNEKTMHLDKKELEKFKLKSHCKKYLQLKKKGVYFTSYQYKRAVKTVNYFAMCHKDGEKVIAKIHYFV